MLNEPSLTVDFAGLRFANPTVLASGILGYTRETLGNIVKGGAGAVVTKSIGTRPRKGYTNPTVVQVECGLVNAMGLPNPGIAEFLKELHEMKKALGVPVIVSVYGYSAEEYALLSKRTIGAGADAVELNVSCPHVRETGSEIGQDPKILFNVVSRVKSTVKEPVIVKLSPNVTSIVEIANSAVKAGADALTIMNTIKAMAIDADTMMPVLGNKVGGLSGPAIKPIALRCVYEVYENVNIPIMGCGGITDWRDAVEFLLAGASAIQIGTAISLKGPRVFRAIARGIGKYLKNQGLARLEEIVGLSHRC